MRSASAVSGVVSSSLQSRVITGLILAPLAVAALFLLDQVWFGVVFGVISGLALYEWGGMFMQTSRSGRALYLVAFLTCVYVLWRYVLNDAGARAGLLYGVCFLWLVCFALVISYPRTRGLAANPWVLGCAGCSSRLWAGWR